MSISMNNIFISDISHKYNELYSLLIEHKWDEFKLKLSEYSDSVDINIKDKKNNYLLTYAILFNKVDIVDVLLEHDANIDIVDNESRSVIYYAINFQYNEILDILLNKNKNNIGISILHIKDKNGKVPIHYAVQFENNYALDKILEHGGSPDIKDRSDNNSLHIAIYTRNIGLIKKIIKHVTNINSRCKNGETALHIACNLQLYEICKLLIDYKINVNIQDYDHEFTALHYAVTLGNLQIVKLLLENNANPNLQDIYGNTALHHSIMENNYSCIVELSKYDKYNVNYNLWNMDGYIPIHILFFNYTNDKQYYIDLLINKSNMIFQNNDGNNCLHYLCMNNIWTKYINVLEEKKIDVFIKNKNGLSPIDYVKEEDIDRFINIVATSYINKLKRFKNEWIDDFDKVCSMDFEELSNKDKKLLRLDSTNKSKINNNYEFEKICKSIVMKKIHTIWKKIQKGNKCPKNQSYPVKIKKCISIDKDSNSVINFCTYTGSILDVFIGYYYLLSKHKSTCGIISKRIIVKKELCNIYKDRGVIIDSECMHINFELTWENYKLHIIHDFFDSFKKCINKKKKYIIIPVAIELINGGHSNYLIYNIESKEIERFEPYGSGYPKGFNYNGDLLDSILEKKFKEFDSKIKYIKPKDYLPKIGFQFLDSVEIGKNKIGDPGGFCALWSLWYTDMRLTYYMYDRKKLVKYLIKYIKSNNLSFKNVIRNYSTHVVTIRDKFLKQVDMDINDWLNDDFTEHQRDRFIKNITEKMDSVL
jgi:ankyrin repeat protein